MSATRSVTIIVPTYQEERHIVECLEAVRRQTYAGPVEVLVVDGGSRDRTTELARSMGATVIDNPYRLQAAALNIGLKAARGEITVRVDGHCTIADDYVERCVAALDQTGAVLVGGAMEPVGDSRRQRAIAAAMTSPLGAGPARFHLGGPAAWVDTVYLGAFRTDSARAIGGYATDVGVNEDSEFAYRMAPRGGVWFDPTIRSRYVPRDTVRSVAKQFWRYGLSRAATIRRHPQSLRWRQLVAPALVVGCCSPWRRPLATSYGVVILLEAARQTRRIGPSGALLAAVLPAMHLPWGLGMLTGLLTRGRVRPIGGLSREISMAEDSAPPARLAPPWRTASIGRNHQSSPPRARFGWPRSGRG